MLIVGAKEEEEGKVSVRSRYLLKFLYLFFCIVITFRKEQVQSLFRAAAGFHQLFHASCKKAKSQLIFHKEKQRGIYKIIHHKKGMMVDHIAKFLGRIYMDPQNFNIKGMFYFFPSAQ